MDIATPLIFGSIFLFASLSLFLVYKFGMKKKSYEEALAEQRQQTSALLGAKPKPKEKKNKKLAKKTKEKPIVSSTEDVDSKVPLQTKPHVEFKEEPEEVEIPPPTEEIKDLKEIVNKKHVKKVRSILIKKGSSIPEQVPPIVNVDAPPNHFEEIHPKDEFELLRSISKEEINKVTVEEKKQDKEKPSKKVKQRSEHQQKNKPEEPQPTEDQKELEEKEVEIKIVPHVQEPVINTGKEKKKKKNDNHSKHPLTAEIDDLINSVRKAELSRTEVQMLIDLLLNKQLEAPAVIDEWSEGKSDPVQKLKKQLAEKEKLLADEQEALVGVQAKLKEIRNEQFAERAQWQQKVKALEESKLELTSANNHYQQKLLEFKELRDEELTNVQKIIDENNALQIQRGQLEVKLMNYQETEGLIHTLRADNEHLSNELQRLSRELQEQQQGYVMQINNLQQETKENIRVLQRGHEFTTHKQIDEIRSLTEELQRLKNDFGNIFQERQDLANMVSQLKTENDQLRNEKDSQINGSSEESKAQEIKVLNLTNELSSVRNELSSVMLKFQEAEQKYRVELDSSNQKLSRLHSEIEEQKLKNNELRQKNWKVMEALNAAESRNLSVKNKGVDVDVDRISAEIKAKEIASQKEFILRLFPDLDELRAIKSADWHTEFENVIKKYVSELHEAKVSTLNLNESKKIAKLQADNEHYQKLIDYTDKLLDNLQLHIATEEIKWRNELVSKDKELQRLKNDTSQLLEKMSNLENLLTQERLQNNKLIEERNERHNKPEMKAVHSDATATIEKLSEEVDRLREQLRLSEIKKNDVNVCQKAQNCISNSTNGSAATEGTPS